MDWIAVLTVTASICGLIIIASGTVIAVKGSVNRARVDALRDDLNDSKDRELVHVAQIQELESKVQKLEAQDEINQEKIAHLTELITQRANVEAMALQMSQYAGEIMDAIQEVGEKVDALPAAS